MLLSDLTLIVAKLGERLQRADGSMPEGHNGPHHDSDTPVRNTAHWAIIFLRAYEISKDSRFELKCRLCLKYLENDFHQHNYFLCRKNKCKNRTNGLIGQIWALEPFLIYDLKTKKGRNREFASQVLENFDFNNKLSLWREIDERSSNPPLKYTINQQIWSAFVHYLFFITYGDQLARQKVESFLKNLPLMLETSDLHVIKQVIKMREENRIDERIKLVKNILMNPGKITVLIKRLLKKEYANIDFGYHYFSVFPLLLMQREFCTMPLYKSHIFKEILIPCFNFTENYQGVKDNTYASPYNPVGIENAIIAERAGQEYLALESLQYQLDRHLDHETYLMKSQTDDPYTLAARFYETVYLEKEYEVRICDC